MTEDPTKPVVERFPEFLSQEKVRHINSFHYYLESR